MLLCNQRESGLELRHRGDDRAILCKRKAVYEQAKQQHPERWNNDIRDWSPVGEVWLNPDKPAENQAEMRDIAA